MGIPTPELGLVLNYSYLWHHEYRAGQEEGRKNRPSVIIMNIRRDSDDAVIVMVLPITHSMPDNIGTAIEIPQRVKQNLGLDEERSWVIIDEVNEFVWPGFDLRKIPKTDDYTFGFLPPNLFYKILEAFGALNSSGQIKTSHRD